MGVATLKAGESPTARRLGLYLLSLSVAYIAGYHGRARHSVSLRPEGSSSGRPAAGADGERSECVARGEEYAAELAQMEGAGGDNDFNASFQSPITTARDGTFLWMAQATGTDKVQYHSYHYMYTRYLAHARFHQLNILEVGLGCDMRYGAGASLRLWRAYLPCSRISFVEYNDTCAIKWKKEVEKVGGGKLYIGSQDDSQLLAAIQKYAKSIGGFDMIIDDGSHLPEHQWTTIEALWRTIKPGGVYIIEDLHDHWFSSKALQPVMTAFPPTLPVPLYIQLIHLMNCHSYGTWKYSKESNFWCSQQKAKSQYIDVINLDCMSEFCAMVKGAPLGTIKFRIPG